MYCFKGFMESTATVRDYGFSFSFFNCWISLVQITQRCCKWDVLACLHWFDFVFSLAVFVTIQLFGICAAFIFFLKPRVILYLLIFTLLGK
jgi:hypothetical protein